MALVEHFDGRQQRFRFVHRRDDYDRLVCFLRGCPAPCRIALEPTGDYHRTIAYRLLSEGFEIVLVSSVAAARLREAIFNSWDKNDPKDAQVIMRLLKQGMTQRYCDPLLMQTHDLQELSKTYQHIACARTRLQHVLLTHYLTLYFPEIERFWTPQRNEWFIRLLLQFPTPASIAQAEHGGLSRSIFGRRWGAEFISRRRSQEILRTGSRVRSLCQSMSSSPAVTTFRSAAAALFATVRGRAALERQADASAATHADYQRLRTVPGIGPIIALVILAEAGDLRRFGHHRQFLKFCGLDLAKSHRALPISRSAL